MGIHIKCGVCGRELNEPGAILLSPPDTKGRTDKFHICTGCFSGGFCLTNTGGLVPDNPYGVEE